MNNKIRIYDVDKKYIDFLRSDPKLSSVEQHKNNTARFGRKHLGIVLEGSTVNYFIPFSSAKQTDYILESGVQKIRKSVIPIVRMVYYDKNLKKDVLLGTLRISNMIPIPKAALVYCDINKISDIQYKTLLYKEYQFIKRNLNMIKKFANILYLQKTDPAKCFLNKKNQIPNYVHTTIDFKYAEKKYLEYCKINNLEMYEQQYKQHKESAVTRTDIDKER